MKFLYEYRTKDNAVHSGVVSASDRDAAYAALKARGIRPSRLAEAPGFANKLFGKGKRWLAIGALALLLIVVFVALVVADRRAARLEHQSVVEPRAQLYGDAGVIEEASASGWAGVFPDAGDQWLARHAIPAARCSCTNDPVRRARIADALRQGVHRPVDIPDGTLEEIAKMKRMVNGMKDELARYLEAGGTAEGYMERAELRLVSEWGIYTRYRNELLETPDRETWRKRNAELRAMGLPMVDRK